MSATQSRVCRTCNTSVNKPEKILLTCKHCKRHWHHSCLVPAMSEAQVLSLIRMMKILPAPGREAEVWSCRRCELRLAAKGPRSPVVLDDEVQIIEPGPARPPVGSASSQASSSTQRSNTTSQASAASASASSLTSSRRNTTTVDFIELDDDVDAIPLPGPPTTPASTAARPPASLDIRMAGHIPDIVEIVDEHSPPASSVPRTAATTSAQPSLSTHAYQAPMPPPQLVPVTTSTASTSFAAYQSPLGPPGRHTAAPSPAPSPAPPRAWLTSTSATPFSRASTGDITGLLDGLFEDMDTDLRAREASRLHAAGPLRSSPPARESTPPRVSVAPSEASVPQEGPAEVRAEERESTVEVEVKLERRESDERLRTPTQRERRLPAAASQLPLLAQIERDHMKNEEEARDEWDAILERRSASAGRSRTGGRKTQRTRKLGPKAIAKREQKEVQWLSDLERF